MYFEKEISIATRGRYFVKKYKMIAVCKEKYQESRSGIKREMNKNPSRNIEILILSSFTLLKIPDFLFFKSTCYTHSLYDNLKNFNFIIVNLLNCQ